MDATILINKQPIRINVTHLSLNPFLNKKQTDLILSHLQQSSYPVILMGDLNMRPDSKGWRMLAEKFQDAWYMKGKGTGFTYPSHRPRARLDYIFASPDIKILDVSIGSKIPHASDHLPVTATLHLV